MVPANSIYTFVDHHESQHDEQTNDSAEKLLFRWFVLLVAYDQLIRHGTANVSAEIVIFDSTTIADLSDAQSKEQELLLQKYVYTVVYEYVDEGGIMTRQKYILNWQHILQESTDQTTQWKHERIYKKRHRWTTCVSMNDE